VLVSVVARIPAYVGAVLGSALDDVDGEDPEGDEAEHEHGDAEDPEEQRRVGGGQGDAFSVRPAAQAAARSARRPPRAAPSAARNVRASEPGESTGSRPNFAASAIRRSGCAT
jgi:hypothetical protein